MFEFLSSFHTDQQFIIKSKTATAQGNKQE